MPINEAEKKQDEFDAEINALITYSPRDQKYIKANNKLLGNVRTFYKWREKIIEGFKNGIFPFQPADRRLEDKDENDIRPINGLIDYEKLYRLISLKGRDANDDLFREYFKYQDPSNILKVWATQKTKRNEIQVNLLKNALTDFKNKIENMSENEFEQPNKIVNIVEKILESYEQKQGGSSLKILTANQMLSRLAISLAQLKAGNYSEQL